MAIAERVGHTMTGIQADVDQAVAGAVEARLRKLYEPAAAGNDDKAAARFDTVAQAFTDAARVTDVETTDAAEVAAMDDTQRHAWTHAAALAAQLDDLLPILQTAAQLAGVDVNDENGSLLAACVHTDGTGKRPLWAAWDTRDTRTGRWGQLAATGAQIRAATLETITEYPRPKPLEHRMIPTKTYGVYEEKIFDPESPDYTSPEQPQRAMIPGKRLLAR
jgi:hypothetical protein